MKHIISIVLILLVNFSFGQPKEKEMTLNGDPVILFVAKNNVSSSISVHTYKLNGGIGAQEISDADGQPDYSNNVQFVVDAFLSVEGVSRCTFDKATHFFTLLTSPSVDLLPVVQTINKD
jgi:hypothetical protein|tara:strand:+ start:931 stop:1290 length:360 start_codon:yes stop_codon:yes gene_type:complete